MQRRCNTHDLPVVTSFLFSLQVRSLFLLQADFLSLEFSLFLLSRDFVSIGFFVSMRSNPYVAENRLFLFFLFLSPACTVAVEYIKYTLVGKLVTKQDKSFVDRKKALRRHICFEFFAY